MTSVVGLLAICAFYQSSIPAANAADSKSAYPDYAIAVIVVSFPDAPLPTEWTTDYLNGYFFTNADSMAAFYASTSNGVVSVNGSVLNNQGSSYTIQRPVAKNSTCDWDTFFQDAVAAADQVTDFSLFNTIMVISPRLTCSTGGHSWSTPIADAGGLYYGAAESDGDLGSMPHHELGHVMGMDHANFWGCDSGSLAGTCTLEEYGDRFSVMGVSSRMLEFAAPHKENLGWLRSNDILIADINGDYTIGNYETAADLPRVLKIPKVRNSAGATTSWFYLEYRQAIDFDYIYRTPSADELGVTKGALVHVGNASGTFITTTLLDMTPGSRPKQDEFDPALPVGYSFTDATSGVSFGVLQRTGGTLTVRVRVDGTSVCERIKPLITVNPASRSGKPGSTKAYTVTVTNRSMLCGKETIEIRTVKAPKKWPVTINKKPSTTAVVPPGGKKTFTVRIKPPSTASIGSYTATIEARWKPAPTIKSSVRINAKVLKSGTQ